MELTDAKKTCAQLDATSTQCKSESNKTRTLGSLSSSTRLQSRQKPRKWKWSRGFQSDQQGLGLPTIGRLSLWLFFFTFILFFLSNSIVQGESLLSLSLSLPGFLPSLAAAAAARWAPTLITLCRYNSFHQHLFLRYLSQLPISRFRVPPETKNNRSGSCRREFFFFFFVLGATYVVVKLIGPGRKPHAQLFSRVWLEGGG